MIRNKARLGGLISLITITAVCPVAHAGTWQPLADPPPMPDIVDPDTGAFLCEGGAAFPMAVASNQLVSTHFDVPQTQEFGASKLEVVANGIASAPVSVLVSHGH